MSNDDLIKFLLELEARLLEQCPGAERFFPVIRSYIYFSHREVSRNSAVTSFNLRKIRKGLRVVGSMTKSLIQFYAVKDKSLLFVAPARHRNTIEEGNYFSKHLDSILAKYGTKSRIVWETGPAYSPDDFRVENIAPEVSTIAYMLATIAPKSTVIRRIETVFSHLASISRTLPPVNASELSKKLIAFDIACSIYRFLCARSGIKKAYFIVYYSHRHLPLIAALNQIGIETVEYQHGIQNNLHPMYSNWGLLNKLPDSMPRKYLLWDAVALNRILVWGSMLGVTAEVVGNLWSREFKDTPGDKRCGTAILVALQIYPEYFNEQILKVVENTPDLSWVFREHPVYPLLESQKSDLCNSYPNIRIVGASVESLESTLFRCRCCITGYSTVGIEAMEVGMPTIFTHKNARDGLADYIDGSFGFYADSAEDIHRTLLKLL